MFAKIEVFSVIKVTDRCILRNAAADVWQIVRLCCVVLLCVKFGLALASVETVQRLLISSLSHVVT